MKKAIILPNRLKDSDLSLTEKVVNKLFEIGITAYLEEIPGEAKLEKAVYYNELPNDADFIIVIGGDGSVIDASRIALSLDIPLIGVNLGKVGYLATIDPEDVDIISKIALGSYNITSNMLLSAKVIKADGREITSERLAVNDVILSRNKYLEICDFKVSNQNGDQINYSSDGIIVSTPVGSTAYSLSAGGPVISHRLDSITVTPICPHSFFNRSIVYNPDEVIEIFNKKDGQLNISIDGREFDVLNKNDRCIICKSDKRIKMISFDEENIFSTLSKKIKLVHDLV